VYATGIVAALHYWWLVKSDVRRPLAYAAVVLVLLAYRAYKTKFVGKFEHTVRGKEYSRQVRPLSSV
jgi:DMSO/TMAO reductase YedYZ heme-binding membrane subunit